MEIKETCKQQRTFVNYYRKSIKECYTMYNSKEKAIEE